MLDRTLCSVDPDAQFRLMDLLHQRCPPDWAEALRPCAARLVNLLIEAGDRSLDDLTPTVTMIAQEVSDAGECGDHVQHDPHEMHRVIRGVLKALGELRDEQRRAGRWGCTQAPPMMFG